MKILNDLDSKLNRTLAQIVKRKEQEELFDPEYEEQMNRRKEKFLKVDPRELMKIKNHKHRPEAGE